jgi:hypothetical protein
LLPNTIQGLPKTTVTNNLMLDKLTNLWREHLKQKGGRGWQKLQRHFWIIKGDWDEKPFKRRRRE